MKTFTEAFAEVRANPPELNKHMMKADENFKNPDYLDFIGMIGIDVLRRIGAAPSMVKQHSELAVALQFMLEYGRLIGMKMSESSTAKVVN